MDPKSDPEYIKIKYQTRKQVISGKIKMSYKKALPLIGPDCAFHLYRNHEGESNDSPNKIEP